jgi:hypothetical protein
MSIRIIKISFVDRFDISLEVMELPSKEVLEKEILRAWSERTESERGCRTSEGLDTAPTSSAQRNVTDKNCR